MKPYQKLKNSIENLIILSRYALDNGVASSKDEKTAEQSIKNCEQFIGKQVKNESEFIIGDISANKFAALIKNKK